MKRILLATCFAALSAIAGAQTFSTLPFATMDSTHDCNEWVDDYIYVVNTTGAPLSLSFVTQVNSMAPLGWDVLLCTSITCSPVVPPNGSLGTIAVGDSAFLHLTCGLLGIQGTGTVRIRVYETGNPTNDDTLTFTYHAINPAGTTDLSATGFGLSQNYPNPFSGSTLINYNLGDGEGQLVVTDVQGKIVSTQQLIAGSTSVVFSEELAPGIYFYSLYHNGVMADRKKMIVQ